MYNPTKEYITLSLLWVSALTEPHRTLAHSEPPKHFPRLKVSQPCLLSGKHLCVAASAPKAAVEDLGWNGR